MLRKLLLLVMLLGAGLALLLLVADDSRFVERRSKLIEQPIDRVWELIVDVEGWQGWWPGVEKVQLLGPLEVGSTLFLQLKGVAEEGPVELVVLKPQRQLTWQRQGVFGSRVETSLLLQPKQEATEVSILHTIKGPQAALADLSNRQSFAEYQELFLKSLELQLAGQLLPLSDGEKD